MEFGSDNVDKFIIHSYELLIGTPPFNDDTVEKIFNNILNNAINYEILGDRLTPEAIDLIKSLLNSDPDRRLMSPQIRDHKFFEDIEWDSLFESTEVISA